MEHVQFRVCAGQRGHHALFGGTVVIQANGALVNALEPHGIVLLRHKVFEETLGESGMGSSFSVVLISLVSKNGNQYHNDEEDEQDIDS
jgi:nitric oxide reductase large subunit